MYSPSNISHSLDFIHVSLPHCRVWVGRLSYTTRPGSSVSGRAYPYVIALASGRPLPVFSIPRRYLSGIVSHLNIHGDVSVQHRRPMIEASVTVPGAHECTIISLLKFLKWCPT